MSDLNVTERRLRPIIDAVSSRNWKQALQQCDKWQKKGEKSDRFLALKASILVNQPDKSQYEKGKAETLQLCRRNPVVTDIEALYQLQESLKHLSLHHEEGPKLWERAIAARPNDKDLLTTLLNGSVSDGDWMSAQKAAMALRKAFPKERQYEFWNILMCYLIHQDKSLPQKDRDTFGKLAYIFMSKAAEAVPTSKEEVLTTGKAIATPEDLALLVKIYISTGHADQAIRLLQSDTLGLQSRVAELDPPFVFSLLLDALSALENQDEVFETCKQLILSGSSISKQHHEDDRVWKVLQDVSIRNGVSTDKATVCLELAKSKYESEPRCRSAYLAFFNLAKRKSFLSSEDSHTILASACTTYFKTFGGKPFCFGDLITPLQSSKQALEKFNSEVKAGEEDELRQVFALKLKHALLDSHNHDNTDAEYLKLVTDAIRLHKRLPKTRAECPEMILLAATSLLRLALKARNNGLAVQATYMLHKCHSEFDEYYPLAIRLVQLHLVQGQTSLAMEKFVKLAVKNMQWETVGHLLLTRISTLHPWQTGSQSEFLNPLGAIDAGITVLENANRSFERAINEGMKFGSYSNIIDTVRMKSNMTRSMNRQMYIVEERRIQRLFDIPLDIPLDPYPADMVDQRDFEFLPDLGDFEGRWDFENSLRCGPLPKRLWLIAMALHDHIATYLKAELTSQTTLSGPAFERLKHSLKVTKQHDGDRKSELTQEEMSNLACDQTMAEALILAKESPVSKQGDFDLFIDGLKIWLDTTAFFPDTGTATINGVTTPTWEFLHANFVHLEALQTISLFASVQARRTKTTKAGKAIVVSKETLAELQKLVGDAEKAVHGRVKKVKDEINASGVLGKLVDAAAGRVEEGELARNEEYTALAEEYADLVDEAALEEYCGRLKDSWEDALDGLIRTKVKIIK